MDVITALIVGFILGAIFSPIVIKLFKIGYEKIDKNVDHLNK
jgi:hypothetical protein